MISKKNLERWTQDEAQAHSKILNAMQQECLPPTTQAAGLLASGQEDGLILNVMDRNGNLHHLHINAYLAKLLATDILEAGLAMGWMGADGQIISR